MCDNSPLPFPPTTRRFLQEEPVSLSHLLSYSSLALCWLNVLSTYQCAQGAGRVCHRSCSQSVPPKDHLPHWRGKGEKRLSSHYSCSQRWPLYSMHNMRALSLYNIVYIIVHVLTSIVVCIEHCMCACQFQLFSLPLSSMNTVSGLWRTNVT